MSRNKETYIGDAFMETLIWRPHTADYHTYAEGSSHSGPHFAVEEAKGANHTPNRAYQNTRGIS
jgi:hypothetical protein